MAISLWIQGLPDDAATAFVEHLKYHPKDTITLANDASLALMQGNTERCLNRVEAALTLTSPQDGLFAILPFLAWVASPTAQRLQSVIVAIEQLDPLVTTFEWDFSYNIPALERLTEKDRATADALIAFFEGKSSWETIKPSD
ncbi:Uncharacterised protein [Candidatus Venteria ishoeyi]|uniref:Tetratricopeptide repeat protein n=1 Tax=Candidatus Venteria ishoeyi TaxID=1899563 RepID=A0A1H6F5Q5_9GAMM|nr:Uncharacterised protein [Candidatus Venteria ishoeyi]